MTRANTSPDTEPHEVESLLLDHETLKDLDATDAEKLRGAASPRTGDICPQSGNNTATSCASYR